MSIDLPACYMHWPMPKARGARMPPPSALLLVGMALQTFL